MLLLLLVESLSSAEGELSWLPPVLTKEWCWGRRKDWREAFAIDGRRTELRTEGREMRGRETMIKEWMRFSES
jgi:hypothetical protein